MVAGAAVSSTSFSLGQEDSLLDPHMMWCSQCEKYFRDVVSSTGLLPFNNSPFSVIICHLFIIVLLKWFRLVLCRWHAKMGGIIWPPFEDLAVHRAVHRASSRFKLLCCSCMVSPRGNPSKLRTAKSPSNRVTFIGLLAIFNLFLLPHLFNEPPFSHFNHANSFCNILC